MNKRAETSSMTPSASEPATSMPRAALTGSERKFLRGLAHELEPIVHVGRAGVTETVLGAIRAALADHELVKVKLAAEREERGRMATAIEAGCDAEVVGLIGTIAVVYRANPDPEKRKIALVR
ncbi:MAG: YhbY family RNA-binding protein [Deltaproteobacteria bacterium]|nr:YhbY family RNA-binding protein [Deltaproteobacteria bacterium]